MVHPSPMTTASVGTPPGMLKRILSWRSLSALVVFAGALSLTTLTQRQLDTTSLPRALQEQDGVRKLDAALDDPSVLNVHVVPHTHDDVGWLKTVEEYYYGLNMTIQSACVKDILDSVVEALLDNPHRTFTYVEMKFFSMWFNSQTDAIKDSVRFLIANKQLSFVNGGWCMHDEAAAHFMGMIDQTTLGHDFLKKELGYIPKVGWQLDPFGHSASQASLLSSRVGFDALYFGRIDHEDLDIRHNTQECEGLWSSSQSWKDDAVFWGLTGSYSGNYNAPRGFCFSELCTFDPQLVAMNRTDLLDRINLLVKELKEQSDRTKGNHIMLTMGEDFNYRFASSMFANTDLLISSLSMFQNWNLIDVASIMAPRFHRINIFYSSPEYYTQMKHAQTKFVEDSKQSAPNTGIEWTTKSDDFFPYSDCPHCFWTGYFTSRQAFKRLERVSSAFLLAARQIESFPLKDGTSSSASMHCDSGYNCGQPLYELEDALGVAQHHDAVSGTAKQHVTNDYSKRLQAGINKAASFVEDKLRKLLVNDSHVLDNLSYCQLLNETVCAVSQEATMEPGVDLFVVVYNALGSNESSVIRLPVSSDGLFEVKKLGMQTVESSFHIATNAPFAGTGVPSSAKYVLAFNTGPLQPVGATVFKIKMKSSNAEVEQERRHLSQVQILETLTTIAASTEVLAVEFDRLTGALKAVSMNNVTVNVSQSWGYYTSFDFNQGDKPVDKEAGGVNQNSGAYIFRPAKPDQELLEIPYSKQPKFVPTSTGLEVHVQFEEPWIQQVTRVTNGLPYVEIEYTVGPVPIDDKRGKEIVTRFVTPMKTDSTFYTDSNGREFQKRQRNFRPSWPLHMFEPVAGNYYPVNAAMFMADQSASLSVMVDRTQGGASILDGSLELMAHRRLLADDSRGVGEPMNETDGGVTPYPPFGNNERWGEGLVIRGTYRIMVGNGSSGASLSRSVMDGAFAPPLVFVASAKSNEQVRLSRTSFSALKAALPPNVMLVTFKRLHGNINSTDEYMIRLGHQFSVNEDEALSKPVSIDLANLFTGFKLTMAKEMTLSANQAYNDWVKTRLDWTGSGQPSWSAVSFGNTTVTLQPMDVRTFVVSLEEASS